MKKELQRILLISVFLIIGCVIGYFLAIYQIHQFNDPAYIALLTHKNMTVPQPIGIVPFTILFGLLFSGIPTGLIFFSHISRNWFTVLAPNIIIAFITFPIYTLAGAISSIPFIIYNAYHLIKDRK